jgi:hypothetical protein
MRKVLLVLLFALSLQTQAQNPFCDSLGYSLGQGQVFNVSFDTSAMWISMPVDSIEVLWSVCNSLTCYNEEGMDAYFQLIQQTDTIKVCYDAYIYLGGQYEFCTDCDSLIYDQNTFSWVMFSMQGNPTNIKEMMIDEIGDDKMYDVYGRELFTAPIGKMYIQNKKKYLKLR